MMIGPTDPEPIFPVPLAQQKLPEVVQAIEVKVLMVNPLAVKGFHVTVVPLMLVIEMTTGTRLELTVPVPMAMQNEVLLQTREAIVLIVTPLWVNAVQVVPGADDPVLEKMVDPPEVTPLTKQTGWAELLGQTIWERLVVAGMVSLVHVAVDPEMVAVSSTPFDEVPDPIARHAGVVALGGQTIEVSWETPGGRALFAQLVPFVDNAAAPPEEL